MRLCSLCICVCTRFCVLGWFVHMGGPGMCVGGSPVLCGQLCAGGASLVSRVFAHEMRACAESVSR